VLILYGSFEYLCDVILPCLLCCGGRAQPDDENFSLAHEFCLQKEYYHSFGDVNPSTVEAFYAE
jgi:hypothetical protein